MAELRSAKSKGRASGLGNWEGKGMGSRQKGRDATCKCRRELWPGRQAVGSSSVVK